MYIWGILIVVGVVACGPLIDGVVDWRWRWRWLMLMLIPMVREDDDEVDEMLMLMQQW